MQLDDLPPALLDGYVPVLVPSLQRYDSMRAWGSRYARLVLERCQQNKRQACRELGISYHTLQAYLRFKPDPSPGCLRQERLAQAGRILRRGARQSLESGGVPW